ncbi:death-associated inhibitor of apoptosis 2-like [Rhopalosiphum maidis]|uniref:death-associated inhibitor of apoptosis 2-like n=1 Tax=Rhopalosiphum maidis TaxID=43146 RepID=UPI000EFDDDDA|nr:death-associated inhibitor of apoptosis 2-like [Rhopalosiphum maidis]
MTIYGKIKTVCGHSSTQVYRPEVSRYPDGPIRLWMLATINGRLKTFNNWPISFLRPLKLAEAGLFYLGSDDQVKCNKCKIEFIDWTLGKDPLQLLARLSPNCPFINEISIICLRPRKMAEAGFFYTGNKDCVQCSKCCKSFYPWKKGNVPVLEHRRHNPDCSYIQGYGEANNMSGLYDPSVSYLQSTERAKRIEGLQWSNCDFMTCFFCAEILSHWTDDDEPWTEHAKWSKTCSHLLLNKGKSFVDQVYDVENDVIKSNQLKLFKVITEQKNTYILETKMKIQTTKKHSNRLQITKTLSGKNQQHLSQMIDPNYVPDCILYKICYKEKIKVIFVPVVMRLPALNALFHSNLALYVYIHSQM